jgi:predicted outer membrane repeat protein
MNTKSILHTLRALWKLACATMLIALLVLLALGSYPARVVRAATISVDNTADNLTAGDGDCTLREAIMNANLPGGGDTTGGDCIAGTAGADTIDIPAGTYQLTIPPFAASDDNADGDLDILGEVTIQGAGADVTFIQAGPSRGNGIHRVIEVTNSDGNLTLVGVTVRYGVIDTGGAGIYNYQGTLTLTDSTITANETTNMSSGGGVYNDGGTLTLTGSTVYSNTATGDGGGIYSDTSYTLTVTSSTIAENHSNNSGGGLVSNTGTLNMSYSAIVDNHAYSAGGLYNEMNTANVLSCFISGNEATNASGGGIGNVVGTLNIANSTLSGNSAAGGNGGGIINQGFVWPAAVNISHCTLSGNVAAGDDGGGLYNYSAFGGPAVISMTNSIVTQSTGGDCVNVGGTINGSNNLIDDYSGGACSGISSAAVDGFEATVYDNGPAPGSGSMLRTHALLPGSNAIDGVPAGACKYASSAGNLLFNDGDDISADQRGEGRPVDYDGDGSALCDIGAFERQADETYTFDVTDGGAVRFGATMSNIQDVTGGNNPGSTTVVRRNQPPGGGTPGIGEMPFYVTISPTTGASLDVTLTLCYTDWEVSSAGAGVVEDNLVLFRNVGGSSWTEVGYDSRDTTSNCVTKNNVDALSAWTLGQAGSSPAVITLREMDARPAAGATFFGSAPLSVITLALGAVAALVGGALLRRARRL